MLISSLLSLTLKDLSWLPKKKNPKKHLRKRKETCWKEVNRTTSSGSEKMSRKRKHTKESTDESTKVHPRNYPPPPWFRDAFYEAEKEECGRDKPKTRKIK